jgi:hypothetical protein
MLQLTIEFAGVPVEHSCVVSGIGYSTVHTPIVLPELNHLIINLQHRIHDPASLQTLKRLLQVFDSTTQDNPR